MQEIQHIEETEIELRQYCFGMRKEPAFLSRLFLEYWAEIEERRKEAFYAQAENQP